MIDAWRASIFGGALMPAWSPAMRMTSVFCTECVCGFHIETPERQFICPKCKRLIVFEWGVAGFEHEQPEACDEGPEPETVA